MSVLTNFRYGLLVSFIALACAGSTLAAANKKRECPNPSKEEREKMAAAHQQMAACLRSEKSVIECRKDLAKRQHQMMGMGCPGKQMHPHEVQKPQPTSG
jgi:hypothetical protein